MPCGTKTFTLVVDDCFYPKQNARLVPRGRRSFSKWSNFGTHIFTGILAFARPSQCFLLRSTAHGAGVWIQPPMHWSMAALCLMLLGNTLIALGLLLQKWSQREDRTRRPHRCCCCLAVIAAPYFWSMDWLCGFVVFIAGHGLCSLGLAFGAHIVMACLNCWCIVATILLAPAFFDELVTVYQIIIVGLIIAGCFVVTLAGPQVHAGFTVHNFNTYVSSEEFLIVCGCTVLAAVVLVACYSHRRKFVASSSDLSAETKTDTRAVFLMTSGAAMCAWYAVLAAKCVAGLHLSTWHYGRNQLMHWQPWVLSCIFVAAAAGNLHLLNRALAAGDAVFVMPMYEALSLVGQVIVGGIFFQELELLRSPQLFQFCFGVVCVLSGIILLAAGEP